MANSGATKRKTVATSSKTPPTPASPSPSSSATTAVAAPEPPKPAIDALADASVGTKYLVLYNLLCFILWYCVVVMLIVTLFLTGGNKGDVVVGGRGRGRGRRDDVVGGPGRNNLFPATYEVLRWTQTLAFAEIVHTVIGLVRAGVFTTLMQVASRLFMVWGILTPFGRQLLVDDSAMTKFATLPYVGEALKLIGFGSSFADMDPIQKNQTAYTGMLIAWSLTECIRYMFFIYFLGGEKALDRVPGWLAWLRYNSFFVLYPLGITCECWLVYNTIPLARHLDPRLGWALMAILGIYAPGAYILYTHMIRQRARIMETKKKPKARTE